jgi:hypothetical protein
VDTKEKESSIGLALVSLVLEKAPESRVAGNSNLQVTSKGPVCINCLGSVEDPKS